MKRIAVLVTLLVFLASTSVVHLAFGQSAIRVYVDGQPTNFDVPPTVIQGRVLVPLRGIFARLGATVDYDTRTQHIVAVHDTQTVELTIGSRRARVNNQPSLLDVPAFTIGGRTMVRPDGDRRDTTRGPRDDMLATSCVTVEQRLRAYRATCRSLAETYRGIHQADCR